MHDDTKAEIVNAGTSLLGSLVKEMVVHRNELEVLETEKEKELELARVQNNKQTPSEAAAEREERDVAQLDRSPGEIEPGETVTTTQREMAAGIGDLMEEEDCEVCHELLEGLRDRPVEEQVRGVKEYGEFKNKMGENATADELKSLLRETTVLKAVAQEQFSGAGGN